MTQSTGKRRWNYANRFIPKKSVKILSQWHCNIINFTQGGMGLNPVLGNMRPATNPVSHGKVLCLRQIRIFVDFFFCSHLKSM